MVTRSTMESARRTLQEASNKYGAREKGFGTRVKYLFTHLDQNQCTEVLEACQNDVKDALAALSTSGIPLLAHGVQSVKITDDPDVPETDSSLPIVSSQTLSTPVPAQHPPRAGSAGPSRRGKSLGAIKTTLDTIEAASGAIPIVGSYMGAAAKVGDIIVQMIQVKRFVFLPTESLLTWTS